MAKKRGQNEGSIRQRKDGTWEARYSAGVNKDGKPIRKSIYGKTRPEVSQKLNAVLTDISRGVFIEPSKITMGEWLIDWLNTYKRTTVKPTTYESYQVLLNTHIIPAIGNMSIKDLKPTHIQKAINDIKNKPTMHARKKIERLEIALSKSKGKEIDSIRSEIETLKQQYISARTVEFIHTIIHSALAQAVKNDLIVKNPADSVELPKKLKKEIQVLSPEERLRFIDACKEHRIGTAFILAIATGLRRGEILGLKWDDIDLDEGLLAVRRTISRVKTYSEDEGGNKTALVETEPKSETSKRNIPLLPEIVTLLEKHKIKQKTERLKAGSIYIEKGYVFANELGGTTEPRSFERVFHEIAKKAGIEGAHIHVLRHTFATIGIENGIDLKTMQTLLGHSSITMTGDVYAHVLPNQKKNAMDKLKGVFITASK